MFDEKKKNTGNDFVSLMRKLAGKTRQQSVTIQKSGKQSVDTSILENENVDLPDFDNDDLGYELPQKRI